MNYGEELLHERVNRLERKNLSRREIKFYLNDYTSELNKTYYFCFEQLSNGYIKIKVESSVSATLWLGETEVVCGESFYLEKGVYEVAVKVSLVSPLETVVVAVSGEVAYHDGCDTKVLLANGFSVISQLCDGVLSLYKYDSQITLIEQIETADYDISAQDGEITVYRITNGILEKTVYLENFSASVITQYNLDGISQVKCSKNGLYVVKSGKLYSLTETENGFDLTDTGLRLKEALTVQDGKAVYRDYDGKIKLCSFSVSP